MGFNVRTNNFIWALILGKHMYSGTPNICNLDAHLRGNLPYTGHWVSILRICERNPQGNFVQVSVANSQLLAMQRSDGRPGLALCEGSGHSFGLGRASSVVPWFNHTSYCVRNSLCVFFDAVLWQKQKYDGEFHCNFAWLEVAPMWLYMPSRRQWHHLQWRPMGESWGPNFEWIWLHSKGSMYNSWSRSVCPTKICIHIMIYMIYIYILYVYVCVHIYIYINST